MKFTEIYFALSLSTLLLPGCYDDHTDLVDTATHIVLSPAVEAFNADGSTASGDECFSSVVLVQTGNRRSTMGWDAEIVGWDPQIASDAEAWATVQPVTIVTQYAPVVGSAVHAVEEAGVEVNVEVNPDYSRRCVLRITAHDGTTADYAIVQSGLKADAAVSTECESLELSYRGDAIDVEYTTNMGDAHEYAIEYPDQDAGWLTCTHRGEGLLTLSAEPWDNEEFDRCATLTITVGSAETSRASISIPVVQLRRSDYYYLWGGSFGRSSLAAEQMTRKGDGVYALNGFFFETPQNLICINKDSRAGDPLYYLAPDGRIAAWNAAVDSSGLEIEANGYRALTVDFGTMTWSWERLNSTPNCLPDDRLADYPTRDYPTAAGGVKTWMTVSLHWDGGPNIGTLRLGSGLVSNSLGQTGGYGADNKTVKKYDARNTALDTKSNGGNIDELTDLTERYGRLYSTSEMLTGIPNGALNDGYLTASPFGGVGRTLTDATGTKYTVEQVTKGDLSLPATDAEAEEKFSNLRMQLQGICPYGWHIANMQDWRDLIWAASQVSPDVSAATACYRAMAGGTIGNLASLLYDEACAEAGAKPSALAAEFGFGLYFQGWRLWATGYQYGPMDSKSRFYTAIPVIGSAYDEDKATKFWRMQITDRGANVTFNDSLDIGNASGVAVRCVRNYK